MDDTITSLDMLLAPTHLNYTALLESLRDYLQVILVCNIVILNPEYNLSCVTFYCFLLFFTVFYCQCEPFQTVPFYPVYHTTQLSTGKTRTAV